MRDLFIRNKLLISITLLCVVLYIVFAYHLERADFLMLISLYGSLFLLFYLLMKTSKKQFTFLIAAGLIFRLLFLFALPNLSQDFYRFIWDGRLLIQGVHPYLHLPDNLMQNPGFSIPEAAELYNGMGSLSAAHYTNYPPISQVIFTLASAFSSNITEAVISMRIVLIVADIGVLYFGRKLLEKLNLPKHLIFWYFLNPFIIIELTGNLHFEGVMLFFLIWCLYAIFQHKIYRAAILLACAISVKLIPLLFLPLFFQRLGWWKMIVFAVMTILAVVILFFPFLSDDFIANYRETIGLWFTNFEFNASWYYVVREIGFKVKGYNIIKSFGAVIPWVIIGFIAVLTFFRKNKNPVQLISALLLALSFYYFTSTTVHPWYITLLVGLSIFTKYRFPIVWSGVIMLSYYTYSSTPFNENLWLIALEYTVVYGVLVWEVFFKPTNTAFQIPRFIS